VINTGILSRTVLKLSQIIVLILDFRSRYIVHLRLTGKRVVDFLLVLIELVTAEALRANVSK